MLRSMRLRWCAVMALTLAPIRITRISVTYRMSSGAQHTTCVPWKGTTLTSQEMPAYHTFPFDTDRLHQQVYTAVAHSSMSRPITTSLRWEHLVSLKPLHLTLVIVEWENYAYEETYASLPDLKQHTFCFYNGPVVVDSIIGYRTPCL